MTQVTKSSIWNRGSGVIDAFVCAHNHHRRIWISLGTFGLARKGESVSWRQSLQPLPHAYQLICLTIRILAVPSQKFLLPRKTRKPMISKDGPSSLKHLPDGLPSNDLSMEESHVWPSTIPLKTNSNNFGVFWKWWAYSNSNFVVAKMIFERFEFWCVQSSITHNVVVNVHVLWPVCIHSISNVVASVTIDSWWHICVFLFLTDTDERERICKCIYRICIYSLILKVLWIRQRVSGLERWWTPLEKGKRWLVAILTFTSFVILGEEVDRLTACFPQDSWNCTDLSGKANDGGIGDMLFSIYQTWRWERSKSFFGEPLKHVITVCGQNLVSKTDDDPLPPVCGFKTSPCARSNVHVCTGTTRTCFNTCARGAGIHGDVLNVHTEVFLKPNTGFFHFQRAATHTHTKHTPRPQRHTHTQHNTQHHTETERKRQRKKERQRKGEDKTREEKRVEREERHEKRERQEEKSEEKRLEERRSKTREGQDEKSERRWKRKWRKIDKTKWKKRLFFDTNGFKTLKPARWISPTCFEKKIPVGRIIPPFFLRQFKIWPCFQSFTWFEFDFSGPEIN